MKELKLKGLLSLNEFHYQENRGMCEVCYGEMFIGTSHTCSQKEFVDKEEDNKQTKPEKIKPQFKIPDNINDQELIMISMDELT